jgi:serine/threonine-protein kinase
LVASDRPQRVSSNPPETSEVDSQWAEPITDELGVPTFSASEQARPAEADRRDSLLLPPPLSISGITSDSDGGATAGEQSDAPLAEGDDPTITYQETELTLEDLRLIAESEASEGVTGELERDAPEASPADEGRDAPPPSQDRAVHGDFERFVGRYEVLCRIGRGGMGSVYLCRVTTDAGFRRLFALKVLHASLSESPGASDLFLQEASLLGWLNHPNVVGVVDAAIYHGQPYLVMDYVEGCSFHLLLKRSPEARTPRLVVSIVLEALAGLHAAHTLSDEDGEPLEIVHCDISPDNLLVGINGVCRLTDFGVARVRANAQRPEVTRGKPGYLSPEQVLDRPVDCRSDVFSMGVVLYNTLTGTRVFDGGTVEEVLNAVLKAPIRPPSKVGLCPPAALDAICLRALQRDPALRYQSAEEMLLDLRAVALKHDLLALPSETAGWVDAAVGEDLRMRRLACLDASRRSREAMPLPLTPSEMPPPLPVAVPTLPPESDPPSEDVMSRTIVLPTRHSTRTLSRAVLVAAAALALVFIAFAIGWPQFAARLFTIDTGGFSTWGAVDQGAFEAQKALGQPSTATSIEVSGAAPTSPGPAASNASVESGTTGKVAPTAAAGPSGPPGGGE